jgi:hypothetical protein
VISNEFRVFPMELIAGESKFETEVVLLIVASLIHDMSISGESHEILLCQWMGWCDNSVNIIVCLHLILVACIGTVD